MKFQRFHQTVSAVYSFFLALTLYPEVARKAQAEIDAVVGNDRLPTFMDRPYLPYINALTMEVFRWNTVAPTGTSCFFFITCTQNIKHLETKLFPIALYKTTFMRGIWFQRDLWWYQTFGQYENFEFLINTDFKLQEIHAWPQDLCGTFWVQSGAIHCHQRPHAWARPTGAMLWVR